jgi:hypothetical protein
MRALVRWLSWWLVLLVIWLAFVGSFAYAETAVGAVAAALAATAMEGIRSRGLQHLLPEPRVASRALRVPRDVVVECWTVMWCLGTAVARRRAPQHGRLRSVPFQPPGTASRASASRAFLAWLASISPNHYVLEVEEDQAATHVLVASSGTRHASR